MSEAEEEEDAICGNCEWDEKVEILVGSEVASRENGIGSFVQRGGCSRTRMDMNNSYLPPLSDDIALLVLARIPRSKYCDLCLVNRRFRSLIRSGELNKIRKKIGFKEPKVFFVLNEAQYCCYEPNTRSCRKLPVCPYDKTTIFLDEKSFCMGTHLFVTRNMRDSDIWRYELELNRWFYGPTMIAPRYFFASADCGSVACIAGGIHSVSLEVLNSAEKYNPESKSWEPLLSSMNKRRTFCSAFYMDSKFYVIGGQNENREFLTCGECYDFERNVWELIPNMLEDDTPPTRNPYEFADFMVVVNNELYYLESPSHHLKVYLKNENTWRKVGSAPVGRYSEVALKSLGNELFVVDKMCNGKACFCTPSPELDDVEWQVLNFRQRGPELSMYNCCVMMV